MLEKLIKLKELVDEFIKETILDKKQFELNHKYSYKSAIYGGHINFLQEHKNMIGKTAYKYDNSFRYSLSCESEDFLNPISKVPIIFTNKDYLQFEKDLANFVVKRFTNDFLECAITENSTDKLNNLIFEWELEGKQDIIKTYKKFT